MKEQLKEMDPNVSERIEYACSIDSDCDAHRSDNEFVQVKKKRQQDLLSPTTVCYDRLG